MIMKLTPAQKIVDKIVDAMSINTVKSYFASGEIQSIADSERRTYGDTEIRWQFFTDLINGDKEIDFCNLSGKLTLSAHCTGLYKPKGK